LSSRQRKAKAEKKPESKKVEKARPARPSGKAPEATVTSRHGSGVVTRRGRGFSLGELAGAGLSPRLASGWGLMLDTRRRSVLDANVSSLKSWSAHPGAAKRVEGRVKEVEEEIEKVGREVKKEAIKVEKEAAKVEREAVKVEREAKEEVAKVEKTVRRRARPKKKEET
jgi:ribosomal protein L13E